MNREKKGEQGFTLIEILAVLVLLAFILTMLAPAVIKQMQKGQVEAARSQIGVVKAALNAYYIDNGSYPATEQGMKALIEKPSAPPVPERWDGPYLEDGKLPLDPWGHELKYQAPGTHNPKKYDLYSLGPDNKEGGDGLDADIGNW
ncbi:MAG TPA: type II secretion system major pseudopilin GspG [Bacillota bacterium]|nr:type II secretion system major pseudopilin GspG [Bacillota bacterium]